MAFPGKKEIYVIFNETTFVFILLFFFSLMGFYSE